MQRRGVRAIQYCSRRRSHAARRLSVHYCPHPLLLEPIVSRYRRAIGFAAADMASLLHGPITDFLPVFSVGLLGAPALLRRTAATGITNRPDSRSNGRWLHPLLDAADQ
jgi:hypothetical protein